MLFVSTTEWLKFLLTLNLKELPDVKGHSQKYYLETTTLQVSLMDLRKGILERK